MFRATTGLQEELGDVLLQVALHAQMEAEAGRFDFNDVADGICKKLIFRHPHVFGDVKAENTDDALASWDAAKLKEKGMKKVSQSMVSIPRELPALMRAQKVQHKAAKQGFDWPDRSGAMDKLDEEINELKIALDQGEPSSIADEFGDDRSHGQVSFPLCAGGAAGSGARHGDEIVFLAGAGRPLGRSKTNIIRSIGNGGNVNEQN